MLRSGCACGSFFATHIESVPFGINNIITNRRAKHFCFLEIPPANEIKKIVFSLSSRFASSTDVLLTKAKINSESNLYSYRFVRFPANNSQSLLGTM